MIEQLIQTNYLSYGSQSSHRLQSWTQPIEINQMYKTSMFKMIFTMYDKMPVVYVFLFH